MSLSYQKQLTPVAMYDPRIQYDADENDIIGTDQTETGYGDRFLVYRGPKNIDYFSLPPTASGGGNAAQSTDWSYFMPDRSSILDRTVYIRSTVTVNITHSDDKYTFQDDIFALQCFPLTHSMRTLQIQLDGNVYSIDLQNSFEHLKYFNYTEDEIKTYSSLCPSLLDNSAVFMEGTSNDVLCKKSTMGLSFVPSRGQFAIKSITNNTTANSTSTVVYEVCEPVQISPLCHNASDYAQAGLTGFAILKLKIVWKDPATAFSSAFKYNVFGKPATPDVNHCLTKVTPGGVLTRPDFSTTTATGNPPASITKAELVITNPYLLIGVMTPSDIMIAPPIVSFEHFHYETHTDQDKVVTAAPTTMGADSSASTTFVSRTYNLSQVPNYVLLACNLNRNNGVYTNVCNNTTIPQYALPDFYFGINNVNIKLGNRAGLLSNFQPQQLYEINRQNKLCFTNYSNSGMSSSPVYSYFKIPVGAGVDAGLLEVPQGCPLLLQFGKDIPLDDSSLAPSVACNTSFQVTLQVTNSYPAQCEAQLTLIFIYLGVYTISSSGGSSYQLSVLSRQDVLDADKDMVDFLDVDQRGGIMVGGSWFSKLKKIGKKAINFIKNPKVQRYLRQGLQLAADLDIPGADLVNNSINTLETMTHGSAMIGGRRGGVLGGVLGGSQMTAEMIRNRLRS